jgi:hypothetical protein
MPGGVAGVQPIMAAPYADPCFCKHLHEIESTCVFAFLIDVFYFYNVPLFLLRNIFIVLKHEFIYINQIDLSDFID